MNMTPKLRRWWDDNRPVRARRLRKALDERNAAHHAIDNERRAALARERELETKVGTHLRLISECEAALRNGGVFIRRVPDSSVRVWEHESVPTRTSYSIEQDRAEWIGARLYVTQEFLRESDVNLVAYALANQIMIALSGARAFAIGAKMARDRSNLE